MTNKPMLSVERELLERFAVPMLRTPEYLLDHRDALDELRALLDKPAYPDRLCHADKGAHPYICGCLKGDDEAQRRYDEHHSKATRHQSEPVPFAWVRFDDDQKAIFTRSKRTKDSEALYVHPTAYRVPRAEQPAPVATDLVHDRAYRDGLKRGFGLGENGQVEQYHKEFSAYQNGIAAEVARLNGVKP